MAPEFYDLFWFATISFRAITEEQIGSFTLSVCGTWISLHAEYDFYQKMCGYRVHLKNSAHEYSLEAKNKCSEMHIPLYTLFLGCVSWREKQSVGPYV